MFVTCGYSQDDVCANNQLSTVNCAGPNNCRSSIVLRRPLFGNNQTCLEGYIQYCCSTGFQDYTDSGESCSEICDDAVKSMLKDSNVLEFSMTHTLFAKDCSGHYKPFARSLEPRERPLDLRPKLTL